MWWKLSRSKNERYIWESEIWELASVWLMKISGRIVVNGFWFTRFKFHLLVVWPQANYLISLSVLLLFVKYLPYMAMFKFVDARSGIWNSAHQIAFVVVVVWTIRKAFAQELQKEREEQEWKKTLLVNQHLVSSGLFYLPCYPTTTISQEAIKPVQFLALEGHFDEWSETLAFQELTIVPGQFKWVTADQLKMKHGQHIASLSHNSITKMISVHIAQAMMSLLWKPFTIGHLVIDAFTRKLKEKAWFGTVVPLRKSGEPGEAYFSKAVCLQATDYIMMIKW